VRAPFKRFERLELLERFELLLEQRKAFTFARAVRDDPFSVYEYSGLEARERCLRCVLMIVDARDLPIIGAVAA
jgi:hypothetical protein